MGKTKVYCAGPLFNQKEKEEMAALAEALEHEGFATFLPQRDGLELSKCVQSLVADGFEQAAAARVFGKFIFALDIFQVLEECQVLVANLNGRVPDEGAVSEAAMAWSAGKTVVGYKADSRSAFGGQDNPLVAGLFSFSLATTIEEVVDRVKDAVAERRIGEQQEQAHIRELRTHLDLGKQVWEAWRYSRDPQLLANLAASQIPKHKTPAGA